MRIAYARCTVLPDPDHDEAPTLAALRDAGHDAQAINWDGPHDPGAFDAIVIRATWNYINDVPRFLDWVDGAARATRLLNSPADIRWNIHKRYLMQLEAAGVPIVPTRLVREGSTLEIAETALARGWSRVVVKPAVGAGSFLTKVFDAESPHAQAFLDRYTPTQDMLVQRYMPSVESGGERALVVIDGELTHAVEKAPRFDDDEEAVRAAPVTEADRAFARTVLASEDFGDLLYARVDVMRDDDGRLVLSELELIEPSLFFPHSAEALARFVRAIERRLGA